MYACTKFKLMSHRKKLSTLKSNDLCMDQGILSVVKISSHMPQELHHTLLHVNNQNKNPPFSTLVNPAEKSVVSNAPVGLKSNSLLMTCHVLVSAPDGSSVEARVILDSASSASFVSECLAQSFSLSCSNQSARFEILLGYLTNPSSSQLPPLTSLLLEHQARKLVSISLSSHKSHATNLFTPYALQPEMKSFVESTTSRFNVRTTWKDQHPPWR